MPGELEKIDGNLPDVFKRDFAGTGGSQPFSDYVDTLVPMIEQKPYRRRLLLLREVFIGAGAALSFDYDNVEDLSYRVLWVGAENEDTAARQWTFTQVVGLLPGGATQEVVRARQTIGPTASAMLIGHTSQMVYVAQTLGRNNGGPFDLIGEKPDGSPADKFQIDIDGATAADTLTCTALLERIPGPAEWSAPTSPFSST